MPDPHSPRSRRSALLCEACGYEIAGLDPAGQCPECGRPIRLSLPQSRPTPMSLLATNYRAIRKTRELFESVRIDVPSGIGLIVVNLLAAALCIVAPWAGVLVGDPLRGAGRTAAGTALWSISLEVLLVALLLFSLTMIEWAGIQALARFRGWRLTPAAAWQVCAHASVGWPVTAITSWLGLIAWINISSLGLAPRGPAGDLASWIIPVAWVLLGVVIFELLVLNGLKRCRYANAPTDPSARLRASPG